MVDVYETGASYAFDTTTYPAWQRAWYEAQLMEVLRTKSVLVPYCVTKEDFTQVKSKTITFSEIFDLEPNWNSTNETTLWKKGMYLDSRSVTINLDWFFDVLKYADTMSVFTYLQNGDVDGIVREKLGQAMVDMLDILARNQFLTHPNIDYAGAATTRATLTAADLFDPDVAEEVRTSLAEGDVAGLNGPEDSNGPIIACVTSPRVLHDIRNSAGSAWLDVNLYEKTGRKFTGEVGLWAGVRWIQTNRMKLWNAGLATNQSTLNGDTVEGQGAAATVDTVYSVGQSTSTRYVPVVASAGFAVGDVVTIHDHSLGVTILDSDGSQETRKIVAKDTGGANRLIFDKPLLKAHTSGNYVTKALNVHGAIFMGGPGVVYAVAERPNVYVPPKIDDALLINRIGWRGLLKFQLFKPEVFRVHLCAGSA